MLGAVWSVLQGHHPAPLTQWIHWSDDAKVIIIDSEPDFFQHVCKPLFRHKDITSFNKQMNVSPPSPLPPPSPISSI